MDDDRVQLRHFLVSMGVKIENSIEEELTAALQPEYRRYTMHIVNNTRPARIGAQLQRSVVRESIKADIPSKKFPIKAHMNSITDLDYYKKSCVILDSCKNKESILKKSDKIHRLKKQIDLKCKRIANASDEITQNIKQTEFYIKRNNTAQSLNSLFSCFIKKMEHLTEKYICFSKEASSPEIATPMSEVWYSTKINELASINMKLEKLKEKLKESSSKWTEFKVIIQSKLRQLLQKCEGEEAPDAELREGLTKHNMLSPQILEQMIQDMNGGLISENSSTLVLQITNFLSVMSLDTNGASSIDVPGMNMTSSSGNSDMSGASISASSDMNEDFNSGKLDVNGVSSSGISNMNGGSSSGISDMNGLSSSESLYINGALTSRSSDINGASTSDSSDINRSSSSGSLMKFSIKNFQLIVQQLNEMLNNIEDGDEVIKLLGKIKETEMLLTTSEHNLMENVTRVANLLKENITPSLPNPEIETDPLNPMEELLLYYLKTDEEKIENQKNETSSDDASVNETSFNETTFQELSLHETSINETCVFETSLIPKKTIGELKDGIEKLTKEVEKLREILATRNKDEIDLLMKGISECKNKIVLGQPLAVWIKKLYQHQGLFET